MNSYNVRVSVCTGALLATVEADTVEKAALLAGQNSRVLKHFGRDPRSTCGTNRETGDPGKSGVFTLRAQGVNKGQIWIG